MSDLNEEWSKLCEEYEEVEKIFFDSFSSVVKKFSAIGSGQSSKNPTDDELSESEKAWEDWQAVIAKMNDFVKSKGSGSID